MASLADDTIALVARIMRHCLPWEERVEFAPDEETMHARARSLETRQRLFGAVVFDSFDANVVSYKIRIDRDRTRWTYRLDTYMEPPGPFTNIASDMRYVMGFSELQDLIDRSLVEEALVAARNNSPALPSSNTSEEFFSELPGVFAAQFPYPCYERNGFLVSQTVFLPLVSLLAWIFGIGMMSKQLVADREQGLDRLMQLYGLRSGVRVCAWLASSMTVFALLFIPTVLISRYCGIWPHSDVVLLYLWLMGFMFTTLCACYMVSAFTKKVREKKCGRKRGKYIFARLGFR